MDSWFGLKMRIIKIRRSSGIRPQILIGVFNLWLEVKLATVFPAIAFIDLAEIAGKMLICL